MYFTLFISLSLAFAREYDFRESHADRAGNLIEHRREQKCQAWLANEAPVCRQNYQAEIQRTQSSLAELRSQKEILAKEGEKAASRISKLKVQIDGLAESMQLAEKEIAWFETPSAKESEFWPGGIALKDFPSMKGKFFHWKELDAASRKNQLRESLESNKVLKERKNAEYLLFLEEFKPVENQLSHLSHGIQQSQSAIANYQAESDRRCNQCPF